MLHPLGVTSPKKRHFVMRITDIRYAGCSFPSDLKGLAMRQLIALAAVAAAITCAASDQVSSGGPIKEDVIRPKTELAAPAANPNLPFEVLKPLY